MAVRSIEGQVVLVTGSAIRIGRAIALHLAAAGATIAVHCNRSKEEAEQTAAEIRENGVSAEVFGADLAKSYDREVLIQQVVGKFGGLHHLVNSASIFASARLEDITDEDLGEMLEVNAVAPVMLIRHALPHLREVGGSVVNIIDVFGDRPWPNFTHYCASKSALLSATRSLAVELAPEVRVNAVGPGAILFPDWADEEDKSRVLSKVPQGRLGEPEEIAETVAFLITGPQHITGQIIAVDGGYGLHS